MLFIFPVPLWFVGLWVLGGLAFLVYDMIEDANIAWEQRWERAHPRDPMADLEARLGLALEPGSCPEFQALLKRLAATRGQA